MSEIDGVLPHLPALQTLRAFEAAGRHLSYSRAAEELCLTHGAVSHHIAKLEAELGGVRLFVRDGQRMLLTDAGQVFLLDVRKGLRTLADAIEGARLRPRRAGLRLLAVSVLPSFAARWLVPRLSRFQAARPGVDVAIHPTPALATLDSRDGIDLAIRYGSGRWGGLDAVPLMRSFVSPVCSPVLRARENLVGTADLLRVTCLRSPRQRWKPWFLAAGLDAPEPVQGPMYDDVGLLLAAAAAHQGIALARLALAADDLASGRLVRLSKVEIEDDYAWFIVWREPMRCDRGDLEAFRQWLVQEVTTTKG